MQGGRGQKQKVNTVPFDAASYPRFRAHTALNLEVTGPNKSCLKLYKANKLPRT